MVIGINANGASISPDPRVARDYSQPVQFTLTAPDGTKVVYTVTVKGAACLSTPTPTPAPTPTPTTTPTPTPTPAPTPTPTPTPAPAPAPTPTPTACTAAAIGSTGYSLVFKGCSAANLAEYYDKTECVRDNATGLIWQGQTAAGSGHLRANDQYKTNFDSTTALQKYDVTVAGNYRAPTTVEVDASTNSIGFKNAVNATNLCGSSAWRMPTKDELLGIVKMNAAAPMIDTDWFPNTPQYDLLYWSASPVAGYAPDAWFVDFFGGSAYSGYRVNGGNYDLLVRLVR